MRAAEIAPAHYLGHLGLPSYPRPAVGPKFKRGAKFVLSQISNRRVPSSVQKSQKQARPRPKHGSPHPSDSPFELRGRQNALSTSRETPASSVLHPIAANPPPPSSITPEPIPRRRRPPQPQPQRPPRLVVEAEAEPSVPEPVQPRRPAPHRCRSNFATLHRTGAVPATPSFAASDLLPLRRHTATATQSTIWPWVRPSLHPPEHRFSGKKKKIGATCRGDHTGNRRRYSSSLIRANLTSPLTPYSSHERN